MIEFFIIGFCVFVIAFRLGWVAREAHAKKVLSEMVEHIEEQEQDAEKENTIAITIDKHNDHYFVYRLGDSAFMAQGASRQELEKRLEESYPGKKFLATHKNLVEVGFIKNESI